MVFDEVLVMEPNPLVREHLFFTFFLSFSGSFFGRFDVGSEKD
jgi:hypothetical protein